VKLRSNRLPVDVFSVALFALQRAAPELALVIDSDETGLGIRCDADESRYLRLLVCVPEEKNLGTPSNWNLANLRKMV
jgi:hypothetical protein